MPRPELTLSAVFPVAVAVHAVADKHGDTVVTLEQARNYLNNLDLSYIVSSMCAESYSLPRWTLSDANYCAQLYKNFLLLIKKHQPEAMVPTREIDEFWHNHILNTKKYYQDSLQIFGHYLHHEPASMDDDPEQLIADFQQTKKYYQNEFGVPLILLSDTLP